MGAVRASYPRFRREGRPQRVVLTDDDAAIIRTIYRHRFVRAEDLFRLFDKRSPDRISRRLAALYRAGYLDRPIAQIDRYGQGGSQSLVYALDNAGARYLKEILGVRIGAADWRSRNRSYTRENLEHTLAVARFLVDLEIACRARPGVSLISFEEILATAPEATRRCLFPLSWTVPIQWHGGKSEIQLAPDAAFGIRVEHLNGKANRAYFFVEIDRGTMTIVPSEAAQRADAFPFRATILRKLYAYGDSFRLAIYQRRFDIPAARVIFMTCSRKRADAILRAAQQVVVVPKCLPDQLFQSFTLDGVDEMIRSLLATVAAL